MPANPVLQCTVQLCRVLNNLEFPHTFLRSQCTPQLHSSKGRLTVLNWFSREMEWQWFSYVPPGHGKIGILWLITLSSKYRSWLWWCVCWPRQPWIWSGHWEIHLMAISDPSEPTMQSSRIHSKQSEAHTHTRGRGSGRESDGTSMQTDSKYTAVADKYADWQTAASTYWADKNADKQTDTERAPVNMIPLPLAMLIVDMLSFWEG